MADNWFQLKNFHKWKNTDMIPPGRVDIMATDWFEVK